MLRTETLGWWLAFDARAYRVIGYLVNMLLLLHITIILLCVICVRDVLRSVSYLRVFTHGQIIYDTTSLTGGRIRILAHCVHYRWLFYGSDELRSLLLLFLSRRIISSTWWSCIFEAHQVFEQFSFVWHQKFWSFSIWWYRRHDVVSW